jgi:hypothetical protein
MTKSRLPELDTLYVYKTSHEATFHHRVQEDEGYPYLLAGVPQHSKENEIHIYHMTVVIDDVMQGITIVTKQSKAKLLKKWLNDQVKVISDSPDLTKSFKQAKERPTSLGIKYIY